MAQPRRVMIADLKVWYPPNRLPDNTFEVRGVGRGETMLPGIIDRPRGTGDWLFMVFHSTTELLIDRKPCDVVGPVLMAWTPHQWHWYGGRQKRWKHSWIHARGPKLDALAGAVSLPTAQPITGFKPEWLEACVDGLHRELARPDPDPTLTFLHMEVLVREAVRAASAGSHMARHVPAPWPDIRRFIDEHVALRLTLAGLARRFHLSPQHLCEGFHRWFGVPPIEYVIRLRLDRARVLLTDRNRSIADIAAEVGWHDAPHFTRMFKQRCGITPRSLRPSKKPQE